MGYVNFLEGSSLGPLESLQNGGFPMLRTYKSYGLEVIVVALFKKRMKDINMILLNCIISIKN